MLEQVLSHGGKIILTQDDDIQLKPAKNGEIEKLFILESHRGLGIGSQLLKIAEDYLENQEKCDFIEIVVFGDNKKVYEMFNCRIRRSSIRC